MNHLRLYRPLVKQMPRFLTKPCFYSRSSSNRGTMKDGKGLARGNNNVYQEIFVELGVSPEKCFGLIQPRSSKSLCKSHGNKMENNVKSSYEILGCGMVVLKNYISLHDQVEIVNECNDMGCDLQGFMEYISEKKEKIGLRQMLLGLKWCHPSFYNDPILRPLTVPDKFSSLVESSIQECQLHLNLKDVISSICSKHCVVKFYTNTEPLAIHEERDEDHWYPYVGKGWPAVSFFIGDSTEFFFCDSKNVNERDKILLESGDVLILGDKSRDILYGLHRIIPNSAPLPFIKKSMLRPGLLYLSFREF